MFGTILKLANSSFQKGMTFCPSIYVRKVMKLFAFIFEQPSYSIVLYCKTSIIIGSPYQMNTLCQYPLPGKLVCV